MQRSIATRKHWLCSELTAPIWWQKRNRPDAKSALSDEGTISPRDPLLAYKKPHLVERVRTAEQQLLDAQQQLAVQVEASMQREARIAELEARLAELEPYRTFVERMRMQMQREERGRFGDLPPGI